ncbi:MAG: SHOCT domain-containing protein [Lachnospiraceae bacterium]|nr:SHOCT domain-containing protein [Lachnospiraceae bacterium]
MSKKIHVRPGKGQSKVGFIAGLLFCLLGLFVVIPIFGPFGIIWTGMAALITFINYRNGFTDKQIDSHVIDIEENGDDVTITSNRGFESYTFRQESAGDYGSSEKNGAEEDVESRLRKLQSLYDQALITREEYEQKKQDILEDL